MNILTRLLLVFCITISGLSASDEARSPQPADLADATFVMCEDWCTKQGYPEEMTVKHLTRNYTQILDSKQSLTNKTLCIKSIFCFFTNITNPSYPYEFQILTTVLDCLVSKTTGDRATVKDARLLVNDLLKQLQKLHDKSTPKEQSTYLRNIDAFSRKADLFITATQERSCDKMPPTASFDTLKNHPGTVLSELYSTKCGRISPDTVTNIFLPKVRAADGSIAVHHIDDTTVNRMTIPELTLPELASNQDSTNAVS